MKKLSLVMLAAIFLLSGCGTTAKFIYPSKADNLVKLYNEPKYDLRVAVVPFDDKRSDINDSGSVFLYLIPFVPYGTITYNRPDGAEMFNTIMRFQFNATEDTAKAVVTSLQRSGLFKDVFFTFGGEKSNADLVVKGDISSTLWEGKTYSYGFSAVGPLLWFFGLPAGSSHTKLDLSLSLNKQDITTPVWKYNFTKNKTIVQGLYYKWGYDVKAYTELMEEGMNEAIKDLDAKLASIDISELKNKER